MRPASSRGTRFHHGFTMVELIIVMIIIGIVGSIAASRFFERSTFDTAAWTEQLRATLRYAQKRAIAQNSSVYVHLTQERVSVCLDEKAACEGEGMRVLAPGGGNSGSGPTRAACGSDSWLCEAAPGGVSMRLPDGPASLVGGVRFDGLGRATMLGNFTGLLQVSGDGITQSVGVDAESGYVD